MMKNYFFTKKNVFKLVFGCVLLLFSYNGNAQNLNFTIDTAVDNGTSITETLIDGTDTYILTVFHSGNEQLDDLGGGDFIFFHSAIDPLNPHMLSITRNGDPVNFMLNSIDYDTLEAGTISLTNQDGDIISSPTSYPLGAGTLTITNPINALDITGINIIPSDNDDLNDFGFHNINVNILNTLGVDENVLNEGVTVFPNPSNGNISIKNSGIALDKVQVTDLNGRIVVNYDLKGIIEDKNLDLSSIVFSGLYFITISTENASTVKKLIIE